MITDPGPHRACRTAPLDRATSVRRPATGGHSCALRPIRPPDPARAGIPAAGRRGSAGGSRPPGPRAPRWRPSRPAASAGGPRAGRAPADALTTPVGPALRGEVLAALDRGAPPRGSRTPQAAGPSRSGSGSSRRRPGRARRLRPPPLLSRLPRDRRRVLQLLAAALGVAALAPVVAFLLGYAFFAVPTPDDAVNNQVALISYADGSQLTRLVPEQGNRMVVPVEQVPRARARGRARRRGPRRSTPTPAST